MGLSKAAISYLIEEAKQRPFSGHLLTLGVQNVFMSVEEFEATAAQRGFSLDPVPQSAHLQPMYEGMVTSEHVFRRLGFGNVSATNVSDFEDADIIFDLNAAKVPTEHAGKYDLVLDAGTLEHVFHLPNALKNIGQFLKPGGRIIHISPSSNHIDHGFYMFSPTFFWDYYAANNYTVHVVDLFRYPSAKNDRAKWEFGSYKPGALSRVTMGGLGGGMYGIAAVAEKPADAARQIVPLQSMYVKKWQDGGDNPKMDRLGRRLETKVRSIRDMIAGYVPNPVRVRYQSLVRGFPLKIRDKF